MSWDAYEIEKFFGNDLDKNSKVARKKAEAIERYIEAVENANPKSQPDAKDAMETILAHFGLTDYEVEDFVIGEYDGPYGTEDIGYRITWKKGLDIYDNAPSHTNDGGFTFTSWGSEWEAWEEEQYNKDPWPKIEHDGPDNGGNRQLWTPDYLHFYQYASRYEKQRGEGKNPVFTFPLYHFLGVDPFVDDDGNPIPIEDLDDTEGAAKEAYDEKDPKWWGFFWAACKHAGWAGPRYDHDYGHFWAERYNELCHPEMGADRQGFNDESEQHEKWMLARYEEYDRWRKAQGEFDFPEGPPSPASTWPRIIRPNPQRGDIVCVTHPSSDRAKHHGVAFMLAEQFYDPRTRIVTLSLSTPMFYIPADVVRIPKAGLASLLSFVARVAREIGRVPNVWHAPDPRSKPDRWRHIPLPSLPSVGPVVEGASHGESARYPPQQGPRPPPAHGAQSRVWVGPPPPGWVKKPPRGGGRGGGISGAPARRRRRKKR